MSTTTQRNMITEKAWTAMARHIKAAPRQYGRKPLPDRIIVERLLRVLWDGTPIRKLTAGSESACCQTVTDRARGWVSSGVLEGVAGAYYRSLPDSKVKGWYARLQPADRSDSWASYAIVIRDCAIAEAARRKLMPTRRKVRCS